MSTVADLTAQAADLIADQLKDAKTPAITSSFQAECVVLTDLLRQAGYQVVDIAAVGGATGVRILTRPDTPSEAVSCLAKALSEARIAFTMGALEETGTAEPEKLSPAPCLYIGPR